MIRSLLIANRGEIAVRVARTAREMGIEPVGVYAESERGAFHVHQMSRAISLGEGPLLRPTCRLPRLIGAARAAGAAAVHPGYGFLSENAAFARAVKQEGLFGSGRRRNPSRRWGTRSPRGGA